MTNAPKFPDRPQDTRASMPIYPQGNPMTLRIMVRISALICLTFEISTCKLNTSGSAVKDDSGSAYSLATPEKVNALSDESAANFNKQGYSAYHSCQDAANIYMRICARERVDCRRFSFNCGQTGHAIVMVGIKTATGAKWCPQEPQEAGMPGKLSNLDESICTNEVGQDLDASTVRQLCSISGIDTTDTTPTSNEWLGDRENPSGTISRPIACAASGKYTTVSKCYSCCNSRWNQPNDSDISRAAEWVQNCKLYCQDLLKKEPIPNDQDGDSVTDKYDMCPDTPLGVIVNQQGPRKGCPLENNQGKPVSL